MSEQRIIFCASCGSHHDGVVRLDEDGGPVVTWLRRPHDPDTLAMRDQLDAIAEEGGKALALAPDCGHWDKVEEVLDAVLRRNDREEGHP